jgi:hypothetical protein
MLLDIKCLRQKKNMNLWQSKGIDISVNSKEDIKHKKNTNS